MSHLDHLRTFIEAYRLQSFSRAAESLGMTQPAASLHIQALEAFVGKPLFVRRARGVTATEAADELARAIGPMIDGLETRMASYRSGGELGGRCILPGRLISSIPESRRDWPRCWDKGFVSGFIPATGNVSTHC